MTTGADARVRYPLDQLLIIASYAKAAQYKVNVWNHGVNVPGRLNKITMILLGAEVGGHSNNHRIFRDLQLPAQGQARGQIWLELVQIEAVRDDLHSFRRVA